VRQNTKASVETLCSIPKDAALFVDTVRTEGVATVPFDDAPVADTPLVIVTVVSIMIVPVVVVEDDKMVESARGKIAFVDCMFGRYRQGL
jgi:hypothetical protein